MDKIAFRMDDVGSCSKVYNQHGRVWWPILGRNLPLAFFANWGGVKRTPPFRKWAPYPELTEAQWRQIFDILRKHNASMTVGVTACWVEPDGTLTRFDQKFPDAAGVIREGVAESLLEIGNHGLTHCVLGNKAFLPRVFLSNRKHHREFWEWLPREIHREHLEKSQEILRNIFKHEVVTFIPPGSVWAPFTEELARQAGLQYLAARNKVYFLTAQGAVENPGGETTFDFHDRDLAIYGVEWLEARITALQQRACAIMELFESIKTINNSGT